MAHFAELDEDNIVQRVVVVDAEGTDGEQLCAALFGGVWKQTSYTGSMRKNFAGAGATYNASLDAFILPRPFPSWTLNSLTCQWEPPVPKPVSQNCSWDETNLEWAVSGKLFFGGYGSTNDPASIAQAINVYELEPFVFKVIYKDNDIVLSIAAVNNILFTNISIQNKSAEIADRFLQECNKIQQTVATDIYAVDAKPNSAYSDITKSPAWLIGAKYGFEFVENAIFAENEYFVLRRTLDKAS